MLAVFEIAFVPTGVDVPIDTGTVIALPVPPAAIAVVEVQLRLLEPTAPVQVQPVPLGTALSVKPVGSVSVTVIVVEVAPLPVLLGVSVYWAPLWPIVHEPPLLFDFASARVGACMVSVAVAVTVGDALLPEVIVAESAVLIVCAVPGALYFTPKVMLPFAAVAPALVMELCAAASVEYVVPLKT